MKLDRARRRLGRIARSLAVAAACAAPIAVLSAGLSACAKVETQTAQTGATNPWTQPGRLRLGYPDEPDSLNPMFAHAAAADEAASLLFAPVLRYDARGELIPELATEVPSYANGGISRDGRTIVLHFRPGVTWSDGAPLDARDLRFTWRAVMNDANNAKTRAGWDDIAAIDLPDAHTARIRLKRTNAAVLGIFAIGGAAVPPLPEHLLGALPDLNRAPFNTHPISSGPYLLAAWNHGSSLEFAANPAYWRGKPKIAALSWRVIPNPDTLFAQLQTHEIDVYPNVTENQIGRLATLSGIAVAKRPIANFRRLAIDCRKPALRDARVRRAIAEAIDWDRINRTIYHGYNLRATSDIMPGTWAAPLIPFYPHDPLHAAALLDAAGFRPGPGGVRANGDIRLALTLSATNKPANEQAEVQMQQELRKIGIEIAVKNYPASLLFAQNGPLYGGTYDLEWSIDTNVPDPDNQGSFSGDFIPPRGANTSFLNDPALTRLSAAALRTFDRPTRKALYQQEEERIHELVPVVFLYWENGYSAYNSDLRGYEPAQFVADNWNAWEWELAK
jgi:peptide/nickel transport system substrate-binding protein